MTKKQAWIDQRIIFQHVPKCGGSSLIRAIRDRLRRPLRTREMREILRCGSKRELARQMFLHGHFIHAAGELPSGIRITSLREPISRVISLYQYIQGKKTHADHAQAITTKLIDCHTISREFQNGMTWQLSEISHDDVLGDPEKAVTVALKKLADYDIVFSVPRLDIAERELNLRLNLVHPIRIGWENRAKNNRQVDPLDNATVASIRRHNAADMMLWESASNTYELT